MIYIDFETYSEADLRECGSYRYSIDQTTEILCMAFAIDDEPVELWTPQNTCNLEKLFELINSGSLIEAHNAFFERCIWQNIAVKRLGFPQVPISQWRCSASKVATLALPRALEDAAKVLELVNKKDEDGKKLMLKLCKPKNASKKDPNTRYTKELYPELYERLFDYCKQDVEVERELDKITRPLIKIEQEIWELDQEINDRGVLMDIEAIKMAHGISIEAMKKALEKINILTDGEVESYTKVEACKKWIRKQGVEIESFDKKHLDIIINDPKMPENVKEIAKIRQLSAKTSTAKYEAMLTCIADDNRIRDNYMYHGASTGRWTGKFVQFQNLPRGKIKDVDTAIDILKQGSIELIDCCYDFGPMEFLSSVIRSVIISPEGQSLYVADYAAIEARGVAWISGQEDLLDGFRNERKIYEEQAAFTYGKKVEDIGKDSTERFVGKTLILACGYGMGAKKFQLTCTGAGVPLELDFCDAAIKSYRKKNNMIVSQWYAQEKAAILAVKTRKPIKEGKVTWFVHKNFLYCKLPSQRCLAYFNPVLKEGETPFGMRTQIFITGEKVVETRKVWCEFNIYGGLIVENIVQAICRDLVAYGMLQVKKAGYNITMHSHDELISEAPDDFSDIETYEKLMCSLPDWAEGFPIKAEGWKGKRYKK